MSISRFYRRIRRARKGKKPRTPEAWVEAYLSLRSKLGFTTASTGELLRRFLDFMRERRLRSFARIDRDQASAWLRSGSPQESTVSCRLTAIRGLYQYLLNLGAVRENVWYSFSHPKRKPFVPHIFSLAELRAILEHVRRKIDYGRPKRTHVYAAYRAMFHTLYACGLRSAEVGGLKMRDVVLKKSVFTITRTKFHKSRLVPFNVRTRELLTEYLEKFRPRDDGAAPDSPFFLTYWRRPFVRPTIGLRFWKVCRAAGVYRRKVVDRGIVYGSTNVHALRHTFAVHRLLKWYEEGANVNAKLPLLATYMGHSDFVFTQTYLTVLPKFIGIAGKLFSDRFETPLKNLEKDQR